MVEEQAPGTADPGAGGSAEAGEVGSGVPETPAPHWTETLTDESLKSNEALKGMSVQDLAKAHLDLQSKHAIPETPDQYELTIPEGHPVDEKFRAMAKEWAHKAGMPKEVFGKFVEQYIQAEQQLLTENAKVFETEWNALKLEKGKAFEGEMARAVKAAEKFVPDKNVAEMLKSQGVQADFARIMMSVAAVISDDTLEFGASRSTENDSEARLKKMYPTMYSK